MSSGSQSHMERLIKRLLIALGLFVGGLIIVSPVPTVGALMLLASPVIALSALPAAIKAQREQKAQKVPSVSVRLVQHVDQPHDESGNANNYSLSVSVPGLGCIESCPFTGELLTCLSWPNGSKRWYANSSVCARFAADLAKVESKTAAVTIREAGIPRLETNLALILPTAAGEEPSPDGFAALKICPLTPTGRKPKYPIEVHFSAYKGMSGNGSHGTLCYLPSGEIGKADIHYWQDRVRHTVSLRMKDDTLTPSYILKQRDFDETPVTIWRDGTV